MSSTRWVDEWAAEAGIALVEVLLVAAIALSLATLAAPLTTQAVDASRARHAAGLLGSRIRAARQQAAATNRTVAVVFDDSAGDWSFRICVDGNGDGVRRADIAGGIDGCTAGPYRLAALFPGVTPGLSLDVPPIDDGAGGGEGVRFGRAAMASCSPLGTCSPGTLYLRSAGSRQFAIRVAGATGRIRVLRFDPGSGQWELL